MSNNNNSNNNLKNDDLIGRLDRILEFNKNCDTKTSIILTVLGIFFTIFLSPESLVRLYEILQIIFADLKSSINFICLSLFFVSLFFLVKGIFHLARVLVPKLKSLKEEDVSGDKSLFFFKSISMNSYLEFREKMMNETEEIIQEDLLSQIYINSQICNSKFDDFKSGLLNLYIGIPMILATYSLGLLILKLN